MLNADDEFTPSSLSRLRQVVRQRKPLIVWVGAGASLWAGLPSWHDSARQMRRVFVKNVPGFPAELATKYIESKAYPELFQLCTDSDEALFNRTLVEQFNSPTPGPVYEQLIVGLKGITPEQIVTTNIDFCLEQALGTIDVIECADLERCSDNIVSKRPFVAKLHGSVSAIQSAVFTSSQYQQIVESKSYIAAVKSIFSLGSVLFLGYGLKDEYVLKLLAENDAEHKLFGNGPHFLVTSLPGPPENGVYRIGYKTTQHQDHRAALTVLNVIHQEKNPLVLNAASIPGGPASSKIESGFYISDFRPSGTHISGQVLELNNPENIRLNALVGLGFVLGELPSSETVAFHDLAVGLTCFDRVFLPLTSLNVFHDKATSEVFWALMDGGAITFVDIIHDSFYVSTPESLSGDIAIVRVQDPSQVETRTSMSIVRKILKPAPGKVIEGEAKIESLASSIVSFSDSEPLIDPAHNNRTQAAYLTSFCRK